jgi:hypothetical protein
MNSKNPIEAIVEHGMRKYANRGDKAAHRWISISTALTEVRGAFGISAGAAEVMLNGLVATGNVLALDEAEEVIDLDECRITELEEKPRWISATELRDWLREHSVRPMADRDRVIAEKLRSGQVPGRNIDWKAFCDDVRDKCNGWLSKSKGTTAWGFGDKQIKRIVIDLRSK